MDRKDFLRTAALATGGVLLSGRLPAFSLGNIVETAEKGSTGFRANYTLKAKVKSNPIAWFATHVLGGRVEIDGYLRFSHTEDEYSIRAEATSGKMAFVNLDDKSILKHYAEAKGLIRRSEEIRLQPEMMSTYEKESGEEVSALKINNSFAQYGSEEEIFKKFYSYGEEVHDPLSALVMMSTPKTIKAVNLGDDQLSISEVDVVEERGSDYDIRIKSSDEGFWGIKSDILMKHSRIRYDGLAIPEKIHIGSYKGADDNLSDINIRFKEDGYKVLFD